MSNAPSQEDMLWRTYARAYDLLRGFSPYTEHLGQVCSLVRGHARPPAALLDAGCGTGNYAEQLAEAGLDVFGVDFSPSMLARTKAKLLAAPSPPRLARAAIDTQLPYLNNSFDVVLSVNSLYASSQPEATLTEFARVLRPDGVAVVSTPRFQPRLWDILKDIIARAGWLAVLGDIPRLATLGLFNAIIVRRMRTRTYHFWSEEEFVELARGAGLKVGSMASGYTCGSNLVAVLRPMVGE